MLIEAMKCHPIPASTPLTEATPVAHTQLFREVRSFHPMWIMGAKLATGPCIRQLDDKKLLMQQLSYLQSNNKLVHLASFCGT